MSNNPRYSGGSFGAVLNGSDRQQIRLYDCSDRPNRMQSSAPTIGCVL
jgi:hypothetical protein